MKSWEIELIVLMFILFVFSAIMFTLGYKKKLYSFCYLQMAAIVFALITIYRMLFL